MILMCTTSDWKSVPLDHLGHTYQWSYDSYQYDHLNICVLIQWYSDSNGATGKYWIKVRPIDLKFSEYHNKFLIEDHIN